MNFARSRPTDWLHWLVGWLTDRLCQKYRISAGRSLLGIHRDGDLIPHDNDVDLAVSSFSHVIPALASFPCNCLLAGLRDNKCRPGGEPCPAPVHPPLQRRCTAVPHRLPAATPCRQAAPPQQRAAALPPPRNSQAARQLAAAPNHTCLQVLDPEWEALLPQLRAALPQVRWRAVGTCVDESVGVCSGAQPRRRC